MSMEQILHLKPSQVMAFFLVLTRVGGLFFFAPMFSSEIIPPMVKAVLAFSFAVIIFPFVDTSHLPQSENIAAYTFYVGAEFVTGALIGLAAAIIFVAANLGGQLIDQEFGISLANVLDPITGEQASIIGQFKMFFAMFIFLLVGGHLILVKSVLTSFSHIPVGGVVINQAVSDFYVLELVKRMFVLSFQIAAPVLISMFLSTIALAIMAKVFPEFNIFLVGFSARLLLGMTILTLSAGGFVYLFSHATTDMEDILNKAVKLMGG